MIQPLLEARAKILKNVSLVFRSKQRQQKDILKSTDLYHLLQFPNQNKLIIIVFFKQTFNQTPWSSFSILSQGIRISVCIPIGLSKINFVSGIYFNVYVKFRRILTVSKENQENTWVTWTIVLFLTKTCNKFLQTVYSYVDD